MLTLKNKRADLVSDKRHEDFLEIAFGENNEILSIKYGLNKKLQEGENPNPTVIKEVFLSQQFEYIILFYFFL